MNILHIIFPLLLAVIPVAASQADNKAPALCVNQFVGTSNFGTTNPGAVCPNGLMSVSPFNVMGSDANVFDKDSRWWSTPYSSDNCFFTGFSHVNLSGVGCPEVGLALTMPTGGPLEVDYHLYGTTISHEQGRPGYYACSLDSYGIKAEVTSSVRTAVERYTYPAGCGNILVNFGQGLTNETGAWIRRLSDTEIEGMRLAGTFCYNPQAVFPVYFAIRISKTPSKAGFWKKQPKMKGVEAEWTPDNGHYKIYKDYQRELAGDDIGYWFSFETLEGEQVELQIAVSFVSCANAWDNLRSELGDACGGASCSSEGTFDKVCSESHEAWNQALGRIRVNGGTDKQKQVFYTALYHTLIHPSILNDANGEYPLMESGGVGKVTDGQSRYTVFSLWDTYRNLHQLMTLVYPEKQIDMLRSMVDIYKEWGWMPKWELFARETFTMEGDPAICVITDSYLKGLRDFDVDAAWKAFVKSATTPGTENRLRPDIDPYISEGYVPLGVMAADLSGDNSVSHALEYYVADNALSLFASALGFEDEAAIFKQRSLGYRNYYDKEYGTLRPLNADGTFLTPFNPRQGENFEHVPGFHEGSAWNYTFYVPFDIEGLAKLMCGKRKFVDKLQMVFDEGLYDPSNEPDIAYPYLFSRFPNEQWRTHKIVADLLERYYTTLPDGIPGNDDTGTMSAWAVFSMMGFYPDCPGEPYYTLTAPAFDSIEIDLPLQARTLTIRKEGNGPLRHVKLVSPDGRIRRLSLSEPWRISHSDLVNCSDIIFY